MRTSPRLLPVTLLERPLDFAAATDHSELLGEVEAPTKEGLWTQLDTLCLSGTPGCDVLEIPHSSNLSNGIYAAARYLRGVANAGARTNPRSLPETMRTWPGLDLKKLSGARWGRDEVEAMGSEYTSKPWDDQLSDGWGWFVGEAVSDVRRNWQF